MPYGIKNIERIKFCAHIHLNLPKRSECICTTRILYKNVQSSFTHTVSKLETTQMCLRASQPVGVSEFIKRRKDKLWYNYAMECYS